MNLQLCPRENQLLRLLLLFVLEDIVNDLNRIVGVFNKFMEFFSNFFLNFINVLAMFFDNLPWGANNMFHDFKLNCKYIYMI